MTWPNTIGSSVPIKQEVDRAEDSIDEYVCDIRVVFRVNIKMSFIQPFTSINGTSSLFQAICQLISEGLVPVSASSGEATDRPVNRPRHFHLLGHLSKTHHQLQQTKFSTIRFPSRTRTSLYADVVP